MTASRTTSRLANGLNPNNPVDALEDPDHDGLSNRRRVRRVGTKIRDADTDGDGILDGEEAVPGADGFVTNPLLADTDGDGVRDALEIALGQRPDQSEQHQSRAGARDSLEVDADRRSR